MLAILAAALIAAAPQLDTVHTADGGRLIGTVVEESAQGISVQLPDGTTRRLPPSEVSRIEYADGSVSTPNRPAPPPTYRPPAYAPPPPSYAPPAYRPVAPPPPPAPAYAGPRGSQPPITPLYGAFGLGGAFPGGYAEEGVKMDDVFGPQLDIWLEGGLRLDPHVALGLYVDIGAGEPASPIRQQCSALAMDCTATTARVGVLLRHTFSPSASSTPWIAAGTGWEFGSVAVDYHDGGPTEDLFSYSGWEALRLMAGVDLRSNPVFGVGLYGGVAFGRYSSFDDGIVETDIVADRFHTTVQAGVRFTLFP
jgi:hypothetical protein